jgi:hypothetical protein
VSRPDRFERRDDHAVFRPVGRVSLAQAVRLVTSAIAFARDQRLGKLLVDTRDLTGFDPPSIAARYFLVHEWARAAGGIVRVAVVARPEMVDPQRFGVTVAANLGFEADVFTSEPDALAWLQRGE